MLTTGSGGSPRLILQGHSVDCTSWSSAGAVRIGCKQTTAASTVGVQAGRRESGRINERPAPGSSRAGKLSVLVWSTRPAVRHHASGIDQNWRHARMFLVSAGKCRLDFDVGRRVLLVSGKLGSRLEGAGRPRIPFPRPNSCPGNPRAYSPRRSRPSFTVPSFDSLKTARRPRCQRLRVDLRVCRTAGLTWRAASA